MKIGVDANAAYSGSNDNFDFGWIARVHAFDKKPLMDGTSPYDITSTNTIIASPFELYSDDTGTTTLPWPAKNPFPNPTDKVKQTIFVSKGVDTDDGNWRDYTNNRIVVQYIKDALGTPTIVTVEVPVPLYVSPTRFEDYARQPLPIIPSFTNEPLVDIEILGEYLFDPVVSRDMLYAIHMIMIEGRSVLRWYQVDISKLITDDVATLVQYGTIDDGLNDFNMPSMSIDKDDNLAFGFSISGPYQFVKPMYTVRMKNDPIGTVRFPLREFAPGDNYYQAVSPDNNRNRYGDYSALCVDPVDGKTHWIFNQYVYRIPQTAAYANSSIPDDAPRYSFGTAWNTKLGAFKIEKTGGTTLNSPQTQNFIGGAGNTISTRNIRPKTKSKKHDTYPRSSHKRVMTISEKHDEWIQHHTPHGEGCHRVENHVECPPMEMSK